jgi:hypothetical protein
VGHYWNCIMNETALTRDVSANSGQRQFAALILATLVTVGTCYLIPSWSGFLTDPCLLAAAAAIWTLVILHATRVIGTRALEFEKLTAAIFIIGMPIVYIAAVWLNPGARVSQSLAIELVALPIFAAVALYGVYRSPWALVLGIAAHGVLWDAWHIQNSSYIPDWYSTGCLVIDLSLALYFATRIPTWRALK